MRNFNVIIVVVLAFVALAKSDFDYAGSTVYGGSWKPPLVNSTGYCIPNATAASTQYQSFSVNFTVDTFVEVVAMFQSTMIYTARLFIYDMQVSAFNTSAAENCEYYIKGMNTNGVVPPMYYGFLLPAGNYTFVVTDSQGQAGQFSVNVRVAQHTGNTYNAANMVRTPTSTFLADGAVTSCNSSTGINTRYDSYTWSQSTSGVYDIHLWFYNQSTSILPMIFLYNGSFPSSGSPSNPPDACADGTLIYASGYLFPFYTGLPSIQLDAGKTYTVVATPGSATKNWAYVGVVIVPTVWGNTTNQPQNYSSPDIPVAGNITTCTSDVSIKYYQAFKFVAQYSGYIFDTGDLNTAQFDTAAVLYNGDNTVNPPSMCNGFIIASDTGDGAPISIFLTPGETYTIIVTAFQPGIDQFGAFPLYMLTGLPLGVPDVTTTGSGTSGTSWYVTGILTNGGTTGNDNAALTLRASWMGIMIAGLGILSLF